MPRRPEIGNVQLYPNRPLKKSDKYGYVLKFYCPIHGGRIRRSCGTRDRREARKVQRECQQRLLNGKYVASGGAITEMLELNTQPVQTVLPTVVEATESKTWEECYERYRDFKLKRIKETSFAHIRSPLGIAERIFTGYRQDHGLPESLLIHDVMTLDMMEYLQERLMDGDECRYDTRSPNTVNSMMKIIMGFVRFCHKRGWIASIPDVERLDVDEVMKGRPITGEEFDRMIKATPLVVGEEAAESWKFAMQVIWHSGFRVGDLMDFRWDDDRHIRPHWSTRQDVYPTITIPSSQKNRRVQEIPMLPGLNELLQSISQSSRKCWIVNPMAIHYQVKPGTRWFEPCRDDLVVLVKEYSNLSISAACGVSEMTIRKWLKREGIKRAKQFKRKTGTIPSEYVDELLSRARRRTGSGQAALVDRLTKERVSRVIALIGKKANIVVRQADERTGVRVKYASAHDIRRGCARRLINAGVSAETLKVIMRHADFATTEKHYGAMRSAQAAANEVHAQLSTDSNPESDSGALVGQLVGQPTKTPQLTAEELSKLKRLLNSI